MSKRIKERILCVHTGGDSLRGSEHSLLEILRGLNMEGRQLLLLCDRSAMRDAAAAEGVEVCLIPSGELMIDPPEYRFSIINLLQANLAVRRQIRRFQPDVVYCNGGRSCQTAIMAARLSGIPIAVHLRAPYYKRYHLLYGTTRADAVIHCSRSMQLFHETRGRFRRSVLVLNGIDIDRLESESGKPGEKTAFPLKPEGTVTLGFLGSLIHRKGVDILISAVDRLHSSGNDVQLLIAGDGAQAGEYRAQVKRLGLEEQVHFIGEITNRAEFYRHIDIHVLPSRGEAFGRTVVEAAAVGVPSVAHRVEGIPEAMCDGLFGELYSPDDSATLAEAIRKIINSGTWPEKSTEIQTLARERFGLQRVVREVLEVLDTI